SPAKAGLLFFALFSPGSAWHIFLFVINMKRFITLAAFILPVLLHAQVNTIQLKLEEDNFWKSPVKESNVKVTINDSIVKHLVTDVNGITGFLEVPDGEYNLNIIVESYKEYEVKKIKMERADGKHLKIKLVKEKEKKKNR
ncbi:MAG: hypothetical protein ACXVC7_10100, partial [Bacteroidia bacterium]